MNDVLGVIYPSVVYPIQKKILDLKETAMRSLNLRMLVIPMLAIIVNVASLAYADDKIFFVSDRAASANWDIYSMNPDVSGITRLTDSFSIENHPDLSPDGTTLVFSSNRTGDNFELYTNTRE